MEAPKIPKVQHYVPQFLLRNFSIEGKDLVYVYDKHSSRTFPTNVRNAACESRFYDFKIGEATGTMEIPLSKLEAFASPIIQKILEVDMMNTLSLQEKVTLSMFFSVQLVRTRGFKETWRHAMSLLKGKILKTAPEGYRESDLEEYFGNDEENDENLMTARFIMDGAKNYTEHFLTKDWLLISTKKSQPFFIGDNPLTMQNVLSKSPYGSIGLRVKGIEIYFPISSTRAIAMLCPSIKRNFEFISQDLIGLSLIPECLKRKLVENDRLLLSIKSGFPFPYSPEHLENFNFLQISQAERFVFSRQNNFDLAEKMIKSDPSFRTGKRLRVN